MATLAIDLETYSSVDLKRCGVYAYTEVEDFQILLFAYAINDGPVQIIDLARGEKLPGKIIDALFNPAFTKTAFNANFERTCLAKHFGREMPAEQWECTAVQSLNMGLPMTLDEVGKVLKLEKQKLGTGFSLIRFFSVPRRKSAIDPDIAGCLNFSGTVTKDRTRNLPEDAPEKWQEFKQYCIQDVAVEQSIRKALSHYSPLPDKEHRLWALDQKINDRGVQIDIPLVINALACDKAYRARLEAEAIRISGIDNPQSVSQLKTWLREAEGLEIASLSKATVPGIIKDTDNESVKRVLNIRQELAKTSVRKYEAMQRSVCSDGRIRGLFQFYGANRTGRWAGRLVQVHNLPQNHLEDLDLARQLVREGDFETLELLFDSVSDTLSQLIRTAFIPAAGHRFIVADFSAIEARIIAWLASEEWRMEVFRTHGKIYEASASAMFRVPIEQITKTNPLRQKGKIAELALGYQGGPGALITMGALKQGLVEAELPGLVTSWRNANPAIVQLWKDVENAAMDAVANQCSVPLHHGITFRWEPGVLFVTLPSGRELCYVGPRILKEERYNRKSLCYEGLNQTTKKWGRTFTYGGKLVENIVQAIARDCLGEAMLRFDDQKYRIVMHVHDEVVIEIPENQGDLKTVCEVMGCPIEWAPGLPLPAAGFETMFYKKD